MSQLARGHAQLVMTVNQTIYVEVIYIIYYICILTNSQIIKADYYSYNINSNNFIHLACCLGLEREKKFIGLLQSKNKTKDLNTHLVVISSAISCLSSLKEAYGLRSELRFRLNSDPKIIKLNPYYISGFGLLRSRRSRDGESCFLINITPRPEMKIGYSIWLAFKIKLLYPSKDRALLENIRNYFGQRGTITVRKDGYIEYLVGRRSPSFFLLRRSIACGLAATGYFVAFAR
jgi:hypothetical protein